MKSLNEHNFSGSVDMDGIIRDENITRQALEGKEDGVVTEKIKFSILQHPDLIEERRNGKIYLQSKDS